MTLEKDAPAGPADQRAPQVTLPEVPLPISSADAAAAIAKCEPDTAAAVAFLRRWAAVGPWCLTAISVDKKYLDTKTFLAEQVPAMERWIAEHNSVRNLYFTPNPLLRPMEKKPERTDIKSVVTLWADLDPRSGEDVAKEQARIEKALQDPPGSLPLPTAVVFSGGGYQAYWRLDAPIPIEGDLARAQDAARFNIQIEILFGSDAVHNVDRILRLPGTVNIPDKGKAKKGRKLALARLVSFDDELVYPLSDFTAAPKLQETAAGGGAFAGAATNVRVGGDVRRLNSIDDLDQWGVQDWAKVLIVQGHDPDNPNKYSSRSEVLFAACCALVRAKVPDEVIYSIITDQDFGISDSVRDKKSNAEKYALRQIERAKEEAIDPWLRKLNEKHAVIGNMGGKCRVIEEVYDDAMKRSRFTRQSFEDFRNRYSHIKVRIGQDPDSGEPLLKPLGVWWLGNESRLQFERMTFAPGREVEGAYNLWRGFACEARPGDCSLFLDHIRDNICAGVEEHAEYLLNWMARVVQHPDTQGETAVVLRGRQGTGKSFFVRQFGALFGRHFLPVSDPKHLVGSFNHHLRDCVLLFGDEAFYAGDKKHEGILKTLITESSITYEAKGENAEAGPNFLHILLASNSDWVIPAAADDRRFLVLDVADQQMQRTEYFASMRAQLDSGGREALLHMLITRDIADFNVRNVPKTKALQEQKELTEEPWADALRPHLGDWPGKIRSADLLKILGIEPRDWDQAAKVKLGGAMRALGFERMRLSFDGRAEHCYARGATERERSLRFGLSLDARGRVARVWSEADKTRPAPEREPF